METWESCICSTDYESHAQSGFSPPRLAFGVLTVKKRSRLGLVEVLWEPLPPEPWVLVPQDVENVQDVQDVQGRQDVQDVQDVQDAQDIRDVKDVQDEQGVQDVTDV